jgi:hypothetical protein
LGRVDISEPLANRVVAEFIDQGHGRGRVTLLISLDRDAVDDDFGKAILGDDARGRSKR